MRDIATVTAELHQTQGHHDWVTDYADRCRARVTQLREQLRIAEEELAQAEETRADADQRIAELTVEVDALGCQH